MLQYVKSTPYNMIHICIDEYEDYKMTGVAYNNTIDHPIYFNDIYEVVLQFDDIFNKNGNPLSYNVLRSFQGKKTMGQYQNKPHMFCDYESFLSKNGKIMTCDIVVSSRRRSNWQGYVFAGNQQYAYENIFDLIQIIEKQINQK